MNAERAANADANPEAQESEEAHEVDIVLEGDEESQGDKPNSYFVAERLKRKAEKLEVKNTQKDEEIQQLREENQRLKSSTAPRPSRYDFDNDDDYDKAVDEWHSNRFKQQQPAPTVQAEQPDNRLKEAMERHYQGVRTMRIANYDECEEKVIEILGDDVTRGIIATAGEQSPQLIGYWGSRS